MNVRRIHPVRTAAGGRNPETRGVPTPWLVAVALLSALSVLAGCSDDPEQRRGAIYRWKADPTPEHVAKIRELLDDGDRDVRATALNVLVSLRVDDAQQLALTGIGDGDRFVRSVAAKLLGDLGNSESVPVLVERLRVDTEAIVRQRAAEALTKLGGEEALAGLARGAADPEEAVRLAAVKGLRKLDPRYAVPSLERVLREDSMWEVRVQAATALGLTGDPAVLPSLEAALEDPNEFVRSAAANAIRVHAEVPPPPAPATESDTEPATANDPGDVEPAASTDGPS